jgi:chitinase
MWDARPVGYVNLETGEEHGRAHPLGRLTNTPAVGNEEFWRNVWASANGLPARLPPVTENSPDLRAIVDRLFEALGSNSNPFHFTLLQDNLNGMKGRIEVFNAPMASNKFNAYLRNSTNPALSDDLRNRARMSFMTPLRELVGMFQYLRADDVVTRIDATATAFLFQLQLTELHVADARGLSAH